MAQTGASSSSKDKPCHHHSFFNNGPNPFITPYYQNTKNDYPSRRNIINFPKFEEAIIIVGKKEKKKKKESIVVVDDDIHDGGLNEDECNNNNKMNTSVIIPSLLDLSIGTRSALTEHDRYIARYGVDGDDDVVVGGEGQQNSSSKSSSSLNHDDDEVCEREEEWERVMDGNLSIASRTNIMNEDSNTNDNDDCNDSFFDSSSRVQCLVTPERNVALVKSEVTERGVEFDDDSCCSSSSSKSSSSSSSRCKNELAMVGLYDAMKTFDLHHQNWEEDGNERNNNRVERATLSLSGCQRMTPENKGDIDTIDECSLHLPPSISRETASKTKSDLDFILDGRRQSSSNGKNHKIDSPPSFDSFTCDDDDDGQLDDRSPFLKKSPLMDSGLSPISSPARSMIMGQNQENSFSSFSLG